MTPALCPDCRAPLSTASPACPACGLPLIGDDAAALGRIDQELAGITARLGALGAERTQLEQRQAVALSRRMALILRLREAPHRVAVPQSIAAPQPTGQPATAAPQRQPATATPENRPRPPHTAETSGHSVQTVLLALGGVLLAVAAIAFTVFAWGRFGIPGRALVLAVLTGVTFALPAVLVRRRLTATAETIALLALVLLALDGYAAWRVGLAGSMPGQTYAGLVAGVVTLAGATYPLLVAVRLPRLMAIVTGQAVLPLLAATADLRVLPWGSVATAMAAGNIAVVAVARRRAVRLELVLATIAGTAAAAYAIAGALVELAIGRPIPGALLLAVLAGLGLVAAEVAGRGLARHVAAAAVAPALALGAFRVCFAYDTGWDITISCGLAFALVSVALVAPSEWRRGGLVGAAAVTTIAGVFPLLGAVLATVAPVSWVLRPWSVAASSAARIVPGTHGEIVVDLAIALGVLMGAAVLLAHRFRGGLPVAIGGVGLLAVVLPVAFDATVYGAVLAALLVAAVLLAVRPTATAFATSVVLTLHAGFLSVAAEPVTIATLGTIAAGWGAVAVLRRRTDNAALAAAAVLALLAVSAEVAVVAAALHAPRLVVAYALVVSSAAAFGAALALRTARTASMAALAIAPIVAYAGALLGLGIVDRAGRGLLAALTALALAGFGAALRRTSNGRAIGATPVLGVLLALAAVAGPLAQAVAEPFSWLGAVWRGAPAGAASGLGADFAWTGQWRDVATLAVLAVVAAAVTYTYATKVHLAAVPAAAAVLFVPLAADAPRPIWLATAALVALAAAAAAVLTKSRPAAGLAATIGAIALASSLADTPSTLTILALITTTGAVIAYRGHRDVGIAIGSAAALAEGYAAAAAAGLPPHQAAFAVLGVAAALAGLTFVLPTGRSTAEIAAATGGAIALALTHEHGRAAATVLTLGGVVVGLLALRPDRRRAAWAAIALEVAASWVWLATAGVSVPEAYTLPGALVGVGAGLWVLRREPARGSWTVLGPGLAAALLPSLALVFGPAGTAWRPLLLGIAALALTLAGGVYRRQAPFVLGAATLALVAARQLWPYLPAIAAAVPTWVPLAAGGLLLVAVGATYETRLRDLNRVREAVDRMR